MELYDAALESALTHEIGHAIRVDSPKLYAELRDFIRTRLYREGGFQNLVKKRQKQYADKLGREISYEYAEEEVICNSLGDILTSERVMDELAGTHRTLFARIWRLVKDFFKKIFRRMRSMDGDFAYKTTEQRVVEKALLVEHRRLEDLFVKALRDASATSRATLAIARNDAEAAKSTNASKTAKTAEKKPLTDTESETVQVSEGKWALSNADVLEIKKKMNDQELSECDEVAKFIDEVNAMIDTSKRTKRKKKIGIITQNHALIINKLLQTLKPNFSAVGYELWIDGTAAEHIEDRHGKNGEADKTMASSEVKSLIPWAVQNADSGEIIKDSDGAVRYSDRFYDSNGERAPQIRLEKETEESIIYVSECVPDSHNKRIWITSAYTNKTYTNKKSSKGQLLNIEDKSSPQPTSKTFFDSDATDTIITDPDEKINPSDEKSLEKGKWSLNDSVLDNLSENGYTYTKEEYEKFGWARANDVLSATENARLRSLFADILKKGDYAFSTDLGEYMITVGDRIDDKIVYMKGDIDDPIITRLLIIDETNETKLSEIRSHLHAIEKQGIRQQTGGIFTQYSRFDFTNNATLQRSSIQNAGYNNQLGAERGAGSGATQKAKSGTRSQYLPVVHTFTDIAGKKQTILKVNSEYMIEGDTHAKYQPSIEAAMEAHNNRLLRRYAQKHDTTVGATKERLAENPNFLKGKFSLRDTLAREQLSAMFYEMAASPVEREIVEKYKAEIVDIDAKIDERRRILERLSEIEGKSGFGGERERLEGRLKGVNAYITGRDRRLFELESARPFKEMVERYDAELRKYRSTISFSDSGQMVIVPRGRWNELMAKKRSEKYYTKEDAEAIEWKIKGFDVLSPFNKKKIVNELQKAMNTVKTEEDREDAIQSVSEHISKELIRTFYAEDVGDDKDAISEQNDIRKEVEKTVREAFDEGGNKAYSEFTCDADRAAWEVRKLKESCEPYFIPFLQIAKAAFKISSLDLTVQASSLNG